MDYSSGNSIPLIQNNPFDEFGDYQKIEVENYFTQDFLENSQINNDIDDVIDHCVMHTLVRDHREEHQDLVYVASTLETIENKENPDVGNGFLQAELHDIEERDELVDVQAKPSMSFNDPVRESPASEGHPEISARVKEILGAYAIDN